MGCGCGAPAASSNAKRQAVIYQAPLAQGSDEPCDYTLEQLGTWLEKINCFKDNGLVATIPSLTNRQMNIYIGVIMSAQNYPTNICYFKSQLDEVQSFITVVTSTGKC